MSDLRALAERLEKATDDDWELNRDLGLALDGWSYLPSTHEVAERFPEYPWLDNGQGQIFEDSSGAIQEPNYLSSLDAAVALCERLFESPCVTLVGPYRSINIPSPVPNFCWADFMYGAGKESPRGWGATLPLALCLTIVRAKLAEAE